FRSHRECGRRGRRHAAALLSRKGRGRRRWTIAKIQQRIPAGGYWTHNQRTCFTRAVSSCTRLYTERSSRIRRAILEVAWMTVVWSRPPNSLPILGSDESVSSRERYMATWRG